MAKILLQIFALRLWRTFIIQDLFVNVNSMYDIQNYTILIPNFDFITILYYLRLYSDLDRNIPLVE